MLFVNLSGLRIKKKKSKNKFLRIVTAILGLKFIVFTHLNGTEDVHGKIKNEWKHIKEYLMVKRIWMNLDKRNKFSFVSIAIITIKTK